MTANKEEAAERAKKQAQAAALAAQVLKARHKDEYDEIYTAAKKELGVA